MAPIMNNDPKCFMKFERYRLIDIQINYLISSGIKKIVLILGYRANIIRHHIEKAYPKINFVFINNRKWRKSNNLVSLLYAKNFLKEETLIMNCDVIFPLELIKKLVDSRSAGARLVIQEKTCGAEEMKFMFDAKKKSILYLSKKIPREKADGEFVGISYISKEFGLALDKYLSYIPLKNFKNNFYEWGFQQANLLTGLPLEFFDATNLPITEIDFPKDYNQAKRIIFPQIIKRQKGLIIF